MYYCIMHLRLSYYINDPRTFHKKYAAQKEKRAKGRNKMVPGDNDVEDISLRITTVKEYQYKTFAIWAASQPIKVFRQSAIEPINRNGTDQIRSAIPNPYVVARFIFSAMLLCREIGGSLMKANIQKKACNAAAIPFITDISFIPKVCLVL